MHGAGGGAVMGSLRPCPSASLPCPPLPSCSEHGVYLLLFLQFNGFLGGLLLLHPQLLVPMLQQIKEGGGRPVGKKADGFEVVREGPETPPSPQRLPARLSGLRGRVPSPRL